MDKVKVLEVKATILAENNEKAYELRDELNKRKIAYMNLMSSPGSGKTTFLVALLNALKGKLKIGVMEADIDAVVDAETIERETGCKAIQLHTGGACHLDADMSRDGLDAISANDLDLVILENVGNLICPAEFDTGAQINVMILSITEGDDKPLKYPLMFKESDAVVFSKIDALPVFDFNVELATKRVHDLNKDALVFPLSAKTGEGMDKIAEYILRRVEEVKNK
ncbi:MAG: hydrogenase nickel incorporation protein HypB [Gammaproteobacteria bacterium]|nr:hydrogenase nickel incorporation protein HypB [Gammaproteobacteria bacterium]